MSARVRALVASLVVLCALGVATGAVRPATCAECGRRAASGASEPTERADGAASIDRSSPALGRAPEVGTDPRGPASAPNEPRASFDLAPRPEDDRDRRARHRTRSPQAPPPAGPPGGLGTWSGALGVLADASTVDGGTSLQVTLYGADWCGYTRQARAWLASVHVPVSEHDVDLDPDARARLRVLNPRGSIPTFEVRGHVLVGFSPAALGHVIELAAREP